MNYSLHYRCCNELEIFGHADACPNRKPFPNIDVDPPKKPKTVRISSSPTACIYCGSETRKGSVDLGEGQFAHAKCQRAACSDDNFSDKVCK